MKEFDTERKTLIVIIFTLITMVAEIVTGYFAHSMALFADGCHMGTHALALLLTYLTYILIRKFANSPSFVFGTGKFTALSGYTSSILLGITGILIVKEAIERFFNPLSISLNEAIIVAIVGFIVNFVCILIMGGHEHCCHEHKSDYNFKAAYMHILSDLMTSVFAIGSLILAKYFGLNFLDPVAGMIGGIIICIWAFGLIKSTSMILLDSEVKDIKSKIIDNIDKKIVFEELHIWKTSEEGYSLIGEVKSDLKLDDIKQKISEITVFNSITLEYYSEK